MARELESNSWTVGAVTLKIARGDLFSVPTDAIVNSEQTDFVLSVTPDSISGQLLDRFGNSLQAELDAQTGGATLSAGSVLTTSGQSAYRAIFHAGFHQPDQWLDSPRDRDREGRETESIVAIRSCIRRILRDLEPRAIRSVAFPLIGTGRFALSAGLLAYEFAREVVAYSSQADDAPRVVWLVVGDRYDEVIEPIVQGMLDELFGRSGPVAWQLGVGFLDRFNQRQVSGSHTQFRSWMLTRYMELLVEYILFNLAVHSEPRVPVDSILEIGRPLTFGYVRKEAQVLALKLDEKVGVCPWPRYMADRLLVDMKTGHRASRIVNDRNAIAHGRAARAPDKIEADLMKFVDMDGWLALREKHGNPREDGLAPWLRKNRSRTTGRRRREFGVLDRITQKYFEYVVPETGETFRWAR